MTSEKELLKPLLSDEISEASQPHTTPIIRLRSSGSTGFMFKKDPFSKALQDLIEKESVMYERNAKAVAIVHCAKGIAVGWSNGSLEMLELPLILDTHKAELTCLQASKTCLAAAYKDGAVKRWYVDSLEAAEVAGDGQGVTALLLTPDSSKILSAAEDNKVRVRLTESLQELSTFDFHTNWVSCFVITPNGETVVTGSFDHTMKVLNPNDSQHTECLLGKHDDWVTCMALTAAPHDFHVLSGSSDKSLRVWSLTRRELLHKLTGHSSTITCMAVAQDGTRVATGSHDTTARVWSLTHIDQEPAVLTGHSDSITCIAFTPYGRRILTGSNDESLRAWNGSDLRQLAVSTGHQDGVSCFLTPDGKKIYSGCENAVHVFGQVDECNVSMLGLHSGVASSVDITSDGLYILSGSEDCTRNLYNTATHEVTSLHGHTGVITNVAFSQSKKKIVSSSWDCTVRVLDTDTREETVLRGHNDWITTFEITTDDACIVSASADKTVRVWDLSTQESREFTGHTDLVTCLVLTSDNQRVISGGRDRMVRQWSLVMMEEIGTPVAHPNWVSDVKLTKDHQQVVSACWDFKLRVWALFDPAEIFELEGHTAPISCMTLSPDNLFAISGSWDKTIRVWNIQDKHAVQVFEGHTGLVTCLCVTSDIAMQERIILSGSEDTTVRAWSLNHMREIGTVMGGEGSITALAATPDCTRVISGTDTGVVQKVDMTWVLPWLRAPNFERRTEEKPPSNSLLAAHMTELMSGSPVEGDVIHLFVFPHYFNVVHISAFFNRSRALVVYLQAGAKVVKSRFGTPFALALSRSAGKCVDILLDHITQLLAQNKGWLVLQEITDDLPSLLTYKSLKLRPFVELLFRKTSQNPVPDYIVPNSELPAILFSRFGFIQPKDFASAAQDGDQQPVEFFVCEFQWNFTNGSAKSLEFLGHLENCDDTNVMKTDLVRSLVDVKWNYFWKLIISLTLMYTALLLCLICLTFGYFNDTVVMIIFIVLNAVFVALEVLQSLGDMEYWLDPWNYLDIMRVASAMLWVLYYREHQGLHALVVCACFFRGFTYFRAFQMTRMFVRMTFQVINEVQSFLIIMIYSTFSFGMMSASLNLEAMPDVTSAWTSGYELLMGAFDNEGANFYQWVIFTFATFGNVILLLNLLVSILGDAYGKVQETSQESDTLEMLRILLEYESLMFWRRSAGEPLVMMGCVAEEEKEGVDEMEAKMDQFMSNLSEQIRESAESIKKDIREELQANFANMQAKLEEAIQKKISEERAAV